MITFYPIVMLTPSINGYDNVESPPPPPPVANAASARVQRGRKYFPVEMMYLFTVMEKVLPIGPIEWDLVLAAHIENFPGRNVESIRRKYTTTHRKKVPTGNPNMPPEVSLAKKVKYLIGEKVEL